MKSTNIAKYKIAAFGSAVQKESKDTIRKANKIGQELAKYPVIIINGATFGLPYEVAFSAYKKGSEIWGFSPAVDLKGQKKFFPKDKIAYKKLVFVPKNYQFASNDQASRKYRNVSTTATCDAGIVIAGRWGTMNEFTNLHDMGKVIGVLTGTGGIADELPNLYKKISKESKAKVIFESNPKLLVRKVMKVIGYE